MKYQLIIVWNMETPELNPNVSESYDEIRALAKRVREMEGPEHGLFYIEWETWNKDTPGEVFTMELAEFYGI
jgi:hypothetical protein